MEEDIVTPGTWVVYHGSLVQYHGQYMRAYSNFYNDRFVLIFGTGDGQYLHNARRKSFTRVADIEEGELVENIPVEYTNEEDGYA